MTSNATAPADGARSRILQGVAANIYGRAVLIGGQLISVPILATRWGAVGYGEWLSLTALTAYLAYTNVGAPGAVRADMAVAYSQGDRDRMTEAFHSSLMLVGGVAILFGLAFTGLLWSLPISTWIRSSDLSVHDFRFISLCLSIQVVMIVFAGVLNAGLSSIGKYALANSLDATRQLLEFLSIIVLVGGLAFRPAQVCLVYPITGVLYAVGLVVCILINAPWLLAGAWRISLKAMRRISGPMLGILGMSFGYYGMSVQFPRVLLSATVGPSAVAVYGVCVMLMRMVRIPLDIPAHAATVEISLAYGKGDMEAARKLVLGTTRFSFWLAMGLVPIVALLGVPVVHIWTNGRLSAPIDLVAALAVATATFSLGLPSQEALMSLNRVGRVTLWMIVIAPFYMAGAYFLSRTLHLFGVALGVIVLDALYASLALIWVKRSFGFEWPGFIAELMKPPVAMLGSELRSVAARGRRLLGKT